MELKPAAFGKKTSGVTKLVTWRAAELDMSCKVCENKATGYFRVNGHPALCCGSQECKDKLKG